MIHLLAKVGNWTPDLRITSAPLCQLSYFGTVFYVFLHYFALYRKKKRNSRENTSPPLTLFKYKDTLTV